MISAATRILLPIALATASTPRTASQASPPPPRQGEVVPPRSSATLSADDRRAIVASLGTALRDQYVFPDIGERAGAKIAAALAGGAYDMLTSSGALAARLAADIGTIAHDKHLRVLADDAGGTPPGMGVMSKAEGGIVRADQLAGGVGYLEVVGFPPPPAFRPVLDKAMAALAGSRALIVDARRNHGGSPEAVAYLVSYFIAPDRPINDIVSRVEKTNTFTRQSYRSQPTPVSFAETPVYVLTSKDTFSGGEELAYDLQALKRATVVGEVTGGGANPTGFVDLGHGLGAAIPFGRAENPTTKANWEGRGVRPDVAVPADGALAAALRAVGQRPVADIAAASVRQVFAPRFAPRPGSEATLRRLIAGYAAGTPDYAVMTPELAGMTRQQLAELQARFAPLGALQSLTFNGPDPLGGDEFRLRFAGGDRMMALLLDPSGKVAAVSSLIPAPPQP